MGMTLMGGVLACCAVLAAIMAVMAALAFLALRPPLFIQALTGLQSRLHREHDRTRLEDLGLHGRAGVGHRLGALEQA
jgi:hypothetical protein